MNGIDTMANQLATITDEPAAKPNEAKAQSIADKALRDILAQADGMAKVTRSALEVCRKIGESAAKARAALAHGKFTPWIDDNFGPGNKNETQFTPQWIRMCMRVHEVFVRLENHKDREKIVAQFGGDVKNFARLLALLEAGNNPLTFKPEPRSAKLDTGTTQGSDNTASAKVLQRKLDAADKKIADLTAKLEKANATIVGQKLEISTLKDAVKAAGKRKVSNVTDVEAKPAKPKALTHGANDMDEARAMAKKGAAIAKAKADKAKGVTTAKPKATKAAKPAKPKATKAETAPVDIDTSDVPADLLANASSTLDSGMGASA